MVDAVVIDLDVGAVMEKRGRGHPSSSMPMKRRPGRPLGSKNKPKPSSSAARQIADVSTAPRNASPPPPVNIFSFFVIVGAQCREQQRVPLKFTKFMDGRELREAILRKESGGGTPYEVEVYYDGHGEMYFRGGWPQFAEDHELHKVFSWSSTTIAVRQSDCTQCQKKYEAEVHFQ
jgi:hypothetical protein